MKDAKGHGSNAKPIPDHRYHSLTSMQLRYIQKDAHEAGRNAHEMGDERGINKYADQVNDASTVLAYRARGGKSDAPEDALHSGTPKSASAPVHDSMSTYDPSRSTAENLKAFTDKYGGPRDHAAEQRAFNRGKREIDSLRRKGK